MLNYMDFFDELRLTVGETTYLIVELKYAYVYLLSIAPIITNFALHFYIYGTYYLGKLIQFMGLRKINTISIKQANKVMHMAAIAYNIKKQLKFTNKIAQTNKQRIAFYFFQLKERIILQISIFKRIENLDFKLI